MPELNASQARRRAAVERLIRLTEPGLNLILAAGDRISRLAEPEDHEYYPARPFVDREPDRAADGGGQAAQASTAKATRQSTTSTSARARPAARSKAPPRARSPRRRGGGGAPQR